MTNETLEKYIEMFNSRQWDRPISYYRIADNVVYAKIWYRLPEGRIPNEDSGNFYFVESKEECVAIVYDMGADNLHWLVVSRHRKKGHLHNALKRTILPYIFSDNREEQRASADSNRNEAYLLKQGFIARSESNGTAYFLRKENVGSYDPKNIQRTPLTEEEFTQLREQLQSIVGELRIIRDRVECAYGIDSSLEEIVEQIKEVKYEIEFECKNS